MYAPGWPVPRPAPCQPDGRGSEPSQANAATYQLAHVREADLRLWFAFTSRSCKPCVTELWRQELRCWKECHPDGEDDDSDEEREDDGDAKSEPDRRGSPAIEIALEKQLSSSPSKGETTEGGTGAVTGDSAAAS